MATQDLDQHRGAASLIKEVLGTQGIDPFLKQVRYMWNTQDGKSLLGIAAVGSGLAHGTEGDAGQGAELMLQVCERLAQSDDKTDKEIALAIIGWMDQGNKNAQS